MEADFGEAEGDMSVLTQPSHIGQPKGLPSAVRLNVLEKIPVVLCDSDIRRFFIGGRKR